MASYGAQACYACGQPGHMAKDCPARDRCHNCQESGHKASDCPKPQRCRRCAGEGHKEADCTMHSGGGVCHNCKKPGHFVKNCPEPELCFKCQKPGHQGKDCTNPPACRRCRQEGHNAVDCKEPRQGVCPFYAQGCCKKGLECDMAHIGAPGHAARFGGGAAVGGMGGPVEEYLAYGEERRRDTNGRRYSKAQFKARYGGFAEWDAAEERMSPMNGKWYTKAKFKEHFGNYQQWDQAMTLSQAVAMQGGATGQSSWGMGGAGFSAPPAVSGFKGASAGFGGFGGKGAGEETRISPANGKAYTKAQFKKYYGGYREWDNAAPAGGAGFGGGYSAPSSFNRTAGGYGSYGTGFMGFDSMGYPPAGKGGKGFRGGRF